MTRLLVISLFSAILVSSASAKEPNKSFSNGWLVGPSKNPTDCSALAGFSGGETLYVSYNANNKTTHISFSNKNETTLQDNTMIELNIHMLRGKQLDEGWGRKKFLVSVNPDGSRSFMIRMDNQILTDIVQNETLGFYNDEKKPLGVFSLTGAADMVRRLIKCSNSVAEINPLDPLAN